LPSCSEVQGASRGTKVYTRRSAKRAAARLRPIEFPHYDKSGIAATQPRYSNDA
jgi:hypothetical protein